MKMMSSLSCSVNSLEMKFLAIMTSALFGWNQNRFTLISLNIVYLISFALLSIALIFTQSNKQASLLTNVQIKWQASCLFLASKANFSYTEYVGSIKQMYMHVQNVVRLLVVART